MASNGFLIVDKPLGLSSRQALDRVRRLYDTRKAGFAGTLDPLASGVLICAMGSATRLLSYLEADAKRYVATVELGKETDTDDAEGREVAQGDWRAVSREQVIAALAVFRGPIRQRPPSYSAISVGGRRLYALARRGETVVAAEREVTIHDLRLVSWQPPLLTLEVYCSKGTYIRALARDLGRALGCFAYLAALRRTISGAFSLDEAHALAQLEVVDDEQRAAYLLPPRAGVAHLPVRALDAEAVVSIRRGQRVPQAESCDGPVTLVDHAGNLVAVGRYDCGMLQPEKVLAVDEP
ncbi:MAG TPA: tRNA pseudouridine(55) synthase TruB [Chloroflexota bacterium]